MSQININQPIKVIGIPILTSNEEAANTIPAHWEKFFTEQIASNIPDKISDNIYAIYTKFSDEGKNNSGEYMFVIGAQVSSDVSVPSDMVEVLIPSSKYQVFDVEKGKPEKVFEKWMEIWGTNSFEKSYVCDFEKYSAEGDICINVGEK